MTLLRFLRSLSDHAWHIKRIQQYGQHHHTQLINVDCDDGARPQRWSMPPRAAGPQTTRSALAADLPERMAVAVAVAEEEVVVAEAVAWAHRPGTPVPPC